MSLPRGDILATLLTKEVLKARSNPGLLALILGLVLIAALTAMGDRWDMLGSENQGSVTICQIWHRPGSAWALYLKAHPPGPELPLVFREYKTMPVRGTRHPEALAVVLVEPDRDLSSKADSDVEPWEIRYFYRDDRQGGIFPYRDWLARTSRDYLGIRPRLDEVRGYFLTPQGRRYNPENTSADGDSVVRDRIPLVLTALVVFALYLPAFSIFITSTGEERDRKVLLALLLTPASATEVFLAKAIFHVSTALIVASAVIAVYRPGLLLSPALWITMALGAWAYVAIGTVVLSAVRRQTTINTMSMLYLILTSLVMFLAQILPPFSFLQAALIENYLYNLLHHVIAGRAVDLAFAVNIMVLGVLTAGWSAMAVFLFGARGVATGPAR